MRVVVALDDELGQVVGGMAAVNSLEIDEFNRGIRVTKEHVIETEIAVN